jgi:hypothetical protein
LKRVAEDQPRAIREIIPETPQWLCDIIAKLHAKNPDDRYQTAREVADVLADCEAQLKANARLKDYSRIPRSTPQRSGRRKWVAAAAVLLLPIIALAVTEFAGVTHLFQRQQPTSGPQTPGPQVPSGTYALAFDGKTARVEIPDLKYDGSYPITVEAWAQVAPWNGKPNTVICNDGINLGIDHEQRWSGWLRNRPGRTGWLFLWSDAPYQPDRWTHVAGVYVNRSWTLFVNGQRQKLALSPIVHVPSSAPFLLGGHMYDGRFASPLKGQLREVRVSRVARYDRDRDFTPARRFVSDKDTLALYHFDEGEGTVLKDSSGNGHHGEIIGAKWVKADGTPIDPPPAARTPPPAVGPFTDADVQRIAALPAEQQVEEVRKELKRRNPGFDGKMETKIEGGAVTEFRIVTDQVTDIAPIRVFNALRVLECRGTWNGKPNGLLADLSPLQGMNLARLNRIDLRDTKVTDAGMVYFRNCKDLRYLYLSSTKVTDAGLAHFKDCENLTDLWLSDTQIGDASMVHFQDCKALRVLNLAGTEVSDTGLAHFKNCKALKSLYLDRMQVGDAGLAHFKGKPLTVLVIFNTGITDLTPLQGMPLEEIRLTPKNITRGMDVLRGMKSLKRIGIAGEQAWPAAEFWQRYDRGEFKER